MMGTDKITRILTLYKQLREVNFVNKTVFTIEHGITERSFDRDIEDLRLFLSEVFASEELLFDRQQNAYYLSGQTLNQMGAVEAFVFSKLLLGNSVFRNDETLGLLNSLLSTIDKKNQSSVYSQLKHDLNSLSSEDKKVALLKSIQDLNNCILQEKEMEIKYLNEDCETTEIKIAPVDIIFSEHWFLIAYEKINRYKSLSHYRIDKIIEFNVTGEHYTMLLKEKYNQSNI